MVPSLSRATGHNEQPEIPTIITHLGVTYGLKSSSSVRHNVKAVTSSSDMGAFQVKCEHIKDIESNQGTVNCEVIIHCYCMHPNVNIPCSRLRAKTLLRQVPGGSS